jgi:2'-5' RNA ligase
MQIKDKNKSNLNLSYIKITMKVAFAILCDNQIHNIARKISLEINEKYQTGLLGAMLPPHISLKQPFNIKNLKQLKEIEKYFDGFAKNLKPFKINTTKISLFETGVIFIDLKQDKKLMNLHLNVLEDLKIKFGIEKGQFEGVDEYHFHCTLAVWGKSLEVYKKIFEEYKNKNVKHVFKFSELAMFVYKDDNFSPGSFFNYKTIKI